MTLEGRRLLVVAGGTRATASSRHRLWHYRPLLEADGVALDWIEYGGGRIPSRVGALRARLRFLAGLVRRAGARDVVLVQKVLLPAPLVRLWRARGVRVVYDFDDALFERFEWGESERTAARRRRRFDRMLRLASHVVAGSPPLAAYARSRNASVSVHYPSLVRARFAGLAAAPAADRRGAVVIGWVGNDQSQVYLRGLQPVLAQVMRTHPGVRLRVCTAGRPDLPELPPDRVDFVPWSEAAELAAVASFDLAVSPLDSAAWSRARGGRVSVLTSLAAGVPVVASPGGGLEELAEGAAGGPAPDDPGLLFARDAREWAASLERLVADPTERARRAAAARALVDREIWADAQYPRLRAALFGGPGAARG